MKLTVPILEILMLQRILKRSFAPLEINDSTFLTGLEDASEETLSGIEILPLIIHLKKILIMEDATKKGQAKGKTVSLFCSLFDPVCSALEFPHEILVENPEIS